MHPASGPEVPATPRRPTPSIRLAETATRGLQRLLREHTTMAVTLAYLFLTIVGATYEFSMLMEFRINVFQYADPGDFLMAAFRQPLVVLFTVLPFVLLWAIDQLHGVLSRWIPIYRRYYEAQVRRPHYEAMAMASNVAIIVLYFVAFTLQYADFVGDRLHAGEGRRVTLALQGPGVAGVSRLDGTLLGTTARYVFLYQTSDSTSHVVPHESIVEMIPRRSTHGRR